MIELKPCPCCGREATLHNNKVMGGYDYSYVRCQNCGLRTKEYQASTNYCSSVKASEEWNRRVEND